MSGSDSFEDPREAGRRMAAQIDAASPHTPGRQEFFNEIYLRAGDDPAMVPWADLKPKDQLVQWLEAHPASAHPAHAGSTPRAIDIACGLGDNAEAIAAAGYETLAFDLSAEAIDWARKRFSESPVDYRTADLFALPDAWQGAWDLVHECFTLQALAPEMIDKTAGAIAGLVAPGGTLLVYSRWRRDGQQADGPPWPLEESRLRVFETLGLELVADTRFEKHRPDRVIPIAFMEWRRPV